MTAHPPPFSRKRRPKAIVDGPPPPSADSLGNSVLWLAASPVAAVLAFAMGFGESTPWPALLLIASVVCALIGALELSAGVRRYAAHADEAALRAWVDDQTE